jgi:hypothetical protein
MLTLSEAFPVTREYLPANTLSKIKVVIFVEKEIADQAISFNEIN